MTTSDCLPIVIAAAAGIESPPAGDPAGDAGKKFKVDPAYAGGELVVAGYRLPLVIDLAGLATDERMPANLDHTPERRVGHVSTVTNDGQKLSLGGPVSASSDSSREFINSAAAGFPWQASVEVQPTRMVDLPAKQTAFVNGRTFEGPILIARQSRLIGLAFVTRGADPHTKVALAQKQEGISQMECNSNTTQGKLEAAGNGPELNAVQAERKRLHAIEASCSGDWDGHEEQVALIRAQAIEGKLSIDGMNEQLLKIIRESRPTFPGIHASTKDSAGDARVIECALVQTLKLSKAEEQYDERIREAAHRSYQGRLGVQQLLIMAAAANGWQVSPGVRLTTRNLGECLAYAMPSMERQINAGRSTASVAGILSNVANKELLAGYENEDQTWREISVVKTVNDFKEATSYRLLDSSDYEELEPGGKIKHGTLGDESYTRQAKTYAKMFTLDRTQIINDDLSAFDDLRNRLGRGAARKFNNIFWAAFLDNSEFFTSGLGNYISGATTNLGTDGVGLEAGVLAFRALRTPAADGRKRVTGPPVILLVPPELEFNARRLFQSLNVVAGGSTSITTAPDSNVYYGLYRPVVCEYLSDTDFTGYSTTAWYLFRNPSLLAPMAVSFLDGQQAPTVETSDADFSELGISFRGYHDFGVSRAEYLAGIKSKGAA